MPGDGVERNESEGGKERHAGGRGGYFWGYQDRRKTPAFAILCGKTAV